MPVAECPSPSVLTFILTLEEKEIPMLQANFDDTDTTGISVVEVPDFNGRPTVFGGLLDAYDKQGYQRGYRRAVADMVASLRLLTEEFLHHQHTADPRARLSIREFQAYLERQLLQYETHQRDFSDGLGI